MRNPALALSGMLFSFAVQATPAAPLAGPVQPRSATTDAPSVQQVPEGPRLKDAEQRRQSETAKDKASDKREAVLRAMLVPAWYLDAPGSPEVQPLPADDTYAQLVMRAEGGDDTVDFTELRMAFLRSPALLNYQRSRGSLVGLRQAIDAAAARGDHATAFVTAQQLLRVAYVDLLAHKARRQACAALNDEDCAKHSRRIELKLLQSILSEGDGESCRTAWTVVTVDEEYAVFQIRNLTVQRQSLVRENGRLCDEMAVTDAGGAPRTFYFDVGPVMSSDPRFPAPFQLKTSGALR